MEDETSAGDSGEGMGLVVRIVGATVVAAIAGIRVYAFIHDFWQEVSDPMALLTAGVAAAVLVGAVWLLAKTLREAE